ncbi:hypothetical protein L3i22_008660 [Actinoplanes sp. L3-i22]|nr:hypothetical protein L3i22_008660 [Actinoplanes sp. L3-i22]
MAGTADVAGTAEPAGASDVAGLAEIAGLVRAPGLTGMVEAGGVGIATRCTGVAADAIRCTGVAADRLSPAALRATGGAGDIDDGGEESGAPNPARREVPESGAGPRTA